LAQKVQELQMENILLKTRIGILEQEEVKEQPKKEESKKEG
jgi:dihydroneopterin aldolase